MLYSLANNFKAVTGVFNNAVYVTTMKIGSITFAEQMEDVHYLNQDNFLPQIYKYFENPDIEKHVNLFIRDPFQRYISGVIQNTLDFDSTASVSTHLTYFGKSLLFHNDIRILSTVELIKREHSNWFLNGLPEEYEDIIINLLKLYYKESAVFELYLDPHVQPFLTPINKLLVNSKINFKTLFLQDFNWRMSSTKLKETRHSNKSFKKVAIEAFNQANNEILINMIKSETFTYSHLVHLREDLNTDYI